MLKFWNFTKHTISLVMLLGVLVIAVVAKVNLDPIAINPVTPRVAGAETSGLTVSNLLPLEITDNQKPEPRLVSQLVKVDNDSYRYLSYFSPHKSTYIQSEFLNVSNPNPVAVQIILTPKIPTQWGESLKLLFTKAETNIQTDIVQPGVMSAIIPAETEMNIPLSYYFSQPVNSSLELEIGVEIVEM